MLCYVKECRKELLSVWSLYDLVHKSKLQDNKHNDMSSVTWTYLQKLWYY